MSPSRRDRERKAEILRLTREFESDQLGGEQLVHSDVNGRRRASSADQLVRWATALQYSGDPVMRVVKGPAEVWHLDLGDFESAPLDMQQRRELCYGKGRNCLNDGRGSTTNAEIVVAGRLMDAGWNAGWWNNYSEAAPVHWREWEIDKLELRRLAEARPGLELMLRPQGGIPDVLAWRSLGRHLEVVAVECKARPDQISVAQGNWITRFQRMFGRHSVSVAEWRVRR